MAILSVYSRPSSMTPPSKCRSVWVRYMRTPELSTQSGEDIIIYQLVTLHNCLCYWNQLNPTCITEHCSYMNAPLLCIQQGLSSVLRPAILTEVFNGFHGPSRHIAGSYLKLGSNDFHILTNLLFTNCPHLTL